MIIKVSTPKYGEHAVIVDDNDFSLIKNVSLGLYSSERHHTIYVMVYKNKKQIRLHRYLLNVIDPKIQVDHINGNGLYNRRENLSLTDSKGNNKNARKRANAQTSKFKGVHKVSLKNCKKPWVAQIQYNKKKITLGYHKTELQAAKVYNKAAIKYFGEFAWINKL